MPLIAPQRLQRFQNRAKSMTGPKVAPKPAQAKETTRKIELSGSLAKIAPRIATPTTVRRAASMLFFSDSLTPKTSRRRFCVTPEAAASSWASAVDIVAARMPARISPAMIAATAPFEAISAAVRTIRFSASGSLEGIVIAPARAMPKPTRPITTATPSDTTHQIEPTRREIFSSFSSRAAIKCSRMWGMPK